LNKQGNDEITICYKYGCKKPNEEDDQKIINILRLKNNYQNELVAVERKHDEKFGYYLNVENEEYDECNRQLKELEDELVYFRQGCRDEAKENEISKKIKKVKKERNKIYKEMKKIRDERKERDKYKQLIEERQKEMNAVRDKYKNILWWQNRESVEEVFFKKKEMIKKRAKGEKCEFRFKPFNAFGFVSLRFQQNADKDNRIQSEKIFQGDHKLFQINPVNDLAWNHPKRSERKKYRKTKVRFCVDKNENGLEYVEIPFIMHRPLPSDSIVVKASINRVKYGDNVNYELIITVKKEKPKQKTGDKTISIDLGWKIRNDGMRVAYWFDYKGDHGELVLNNDIIHQFKEYRKAKSAKEDHFNAIKAELVGWIKLNEDIIPDWFQNHFKHTKYIANWKNEKRMVYLFHDWKNNRFEGDELFFSRLNEWKNKTKHLYNWEYNLREQVIKRRNEVYKVFASKLKEYDNVVIEKIDLNKMSRKNNIEDGTKTTQAKDTQKVIASPSSLKNAIENLARKEGINVIVEDPKNTSLQCFNCGKIEKYEDYDYKNCSCGIYIDRDLNASINLYKKVSQIDSIIEQKIICENMKFDMCDKIS